MSETRGNHLANDLQELLASWKMDAGSLALIEQAKHIIDACLLQLTEDFYEPFLMDAAMRRLMQDKATRTRAINAMRDHWRRLLSGAFTPAMVQEAERIGKRHHDLGVTARHFFVASQRMLDQLVRAILAVHPPQETDVIDAVTRMVMMDGEICLKSYTQSVIAEEAAMIVTRETRKLQAQLREVETLAYVDSLTRLFNRRYFDQALDAEIARSLRFDQPLCLAMVDIDFFKLVNDAHGHAGGDTVLRNLSDRIRRIARQSDICARFGGEEFALILPNTVLVQAAAFAERLRYAIAAEPIEVAPDTAIDLTVSIGVAGFAPRHTAEILVAHTDAALYRAKASGRNRVVVWHPDDAPEPAPACR